MSEEFDLTGRIAWVTGAGKGLGEAMARALANRGATVILTARTEPDVQRVAQSLTKLGHTAVALPGSVTDSSMVDQITERVISTYRHLDVLVNCAGISPLFKRSEEITDDDWTHVLTTNLNGTFYCCRAAGTHMLQAGAGSILNISSVHATSGFSRIAPYAASKGAVEALTRTLAVEWADRGVRVNAIAPGYFHTELAEPLLKSRWAETIRAQIPQQHIGTPTDLGGATVFLASDAARYVTGSTISVDGGWRAQ